MSSSAFNSLLDVFASPTQVFERIREKQISPWIPLLLLLLIGGGLSVWYYMGVDLYQFMETSMRISGQTPTPAELDQILQQESIIRIVSSAMGGIAPVFYYLLLALFFFLAALVVAEEKLSFGQFFNVVVWGSLPSLVSYLSMLITLAMANDFVYITSLDKTSLASILRMALDAPHYDLAAILSVGTVWSYVLYGVGFAVVTRSSAVTAVIVAAIPPAIQFGLTYLF